MVSSLRNRCAALMDRSIQPPKQDGEVMRIQLWKSTTLSWDQRWFLLFKYRIDYYQGIELRSTITLSNITTIILEQDGDYGYNLKITLNSGREIREILLWNGGFSFANIKKIQTNDEISNLELFKNIIVKQIYPNAGVSLDYLIFKYNYRKTLLLEQEPYSLYEMNVEDYGDFRYLHALYSDSGDEMPNFAITNMPLVFLSIL